MSRRRVWTGAAVVVLLVAVAFAINRVTATGSSVPKPSVALVQQADLDPCPAATAGSAAPNGLPDLTLPCLGAGPAVNLARLRGPLVVNIWSSHCTPCRAEGPLLQRFFAAHGSRVGVLGVVDGAFPDTPSDALSLAAGLGLHYPSVFDATGTLVNRLALTGIPVTLYVAADGSIAGRHIGELHRGDLERDASRYLGLSLS